MISRLLEELDGAASARNGERDEGRIEIAHGYKRTVMATLTVELTLDQFVEAIKRLPQEEQVELFDALEDYLLGKHIEATEGEELLSREEAMRHLTEES